MSTQSTRFGITLPDGTDTVTRQSFIDNWNIIDSKAALDADLTAHEDNNNNPHGVTISQIGAAPIAHVGAGGIGVHAQVTAAADGFMIAADKQKLDGIAAGANNYVLPADVAKTDVAQTWQQPQTFNGGLVSNAGRLVVGGVDGSNNMWFGTGKTSEPGDLAFGWLTDASGNITQVAFKHKVITDNTTLDDATGNIILQNGKSISAPGGGTLLLGPAGVTWNAKAGATTPAGTYGAAFAAQANDGTIIFQAGASTSASAPYAVSTKNNTLDDGAGKSAWLEGMTYAGRDVIPNYDQYATNPDSGNVYVDLQLKRPGGGTLFMQSALSNPDANGNYQTMTWTFYAADGTTVTATHVWALTWDANKNCTQKVMTS